MSQHRILSRQGLRDLLVFESALLEAREKARDEGRNPTLRELLDEAEELLLEHEANRTGQSH
jgi:hypothetical protein